MKRYILILLLVAVGSWMVTENSNAPAVPFVSDCHFAYETTIREQYWVPKHDDNWYKPLRNSHLSKVKVWIGSYAVDHQPRRTVVNMQGRWRVDEAFAFQPFETTWEVKPSEGTDNVICVFEPVETDDRPNPRYYFEYININGEVDRSLSPCVDDLGSDMMGECPDYAPR